MRSAEDLPVVGYLDRQGKILVHVWNREYGSGLTTETCLSQTSELRVCHRQPCPFIIHRPVGSATPQLSVPLARNPRHGTTGRSQIIAGEYWNISFEK